MAKYFEPFYFSAELFTGARVCEELFHGKPGNMIFAPGNKQNYFAPWIFVSLTLIQNKFMSFTPSVKQSSIELTPIFKLKSFKDHCEIVTI